MRRKSKRLILISGALGVAGLAAGLTLFALRDSVVFFYGPTEFAQKSPPPGTRLRIGGLVEAGSLAHVGDATVHFAVTDNSRAVRVSYTGILPDLFREGQGVVAEGVVTGPGQFAADSVLSSCLPAAKVIVDLGGAASSIYEMGYPYEFDMITNVDLPPDDRHDMYRDLPDNNRITPQGPIRTLLTNMTDLGAIESGSVDLVWSGQSIEHITEADSKLVYAEVLRILKPGGSFCLDTPNRALTEIHIGNDDWIHPEHKIEYYPAHLQRNLTRAGFEIVDKLGLIEMVNTKRLGRIDYRDFYLSAGINSFPELSYIQYYHCRPRAGGAQGKGHWGLNVVE